MPQERTLLGAEGSRRVERVRARPREGWGPLYRAPNRRWVMPGSGPVHWRGHGELLVVDDLTAFHLAPGELYQLQYESLRDHVVLSEDEGPAADAVRRAWLVPPARLLELRIALRDLRNGNPLAEAAAGIRHVLAASRPLQTHAPPPALVRVRRFLAREALGPHSIEEIGEAAHASPFHLEHLLRRHLGLSLHQYRIWLRLAVAIRRLEDGERDLAGLAQDLGFSSQSHFGARFRRETGMTPGQARRALARGSAGFR